MQLRRRINEKRHRPALAVVLSTALVAAAAFGGNQVLNTQSAGGGPVEVFKATESLADGADVTVDDPAVAAQGGEGPRTVKEFTRDEEFSMFALTWTGDHDIAAFVRAENLDGGWGPWYPMEPADENDGRGDGTQGTELIYVEPTHRVQVSTAGVDMLGDGDGAPENATEQPASPAEQTEQTAGDAASATAPAPANWADIKPVAEAQDTAGGTASAADFDAVFIDGNAQEGGIAPAAATDGMPDVVSRAGWGADESKRCMSPQIDDHVSALTIHHTAGSNNYTPAQAAAQVRGIYNYHAITLGWCDIGYNALVDKYGTIYEGRYGGLTKAVQGAHAGGFNQNTWGISMIGDYSSLTPPQQTIDAVGKLAGWRAAVAGFDPTGSSTHYSEGTSYTFYPYGQAVRLPNIFAHRDVGTTTCPGDAGYAQMDRIRALAKKHYDAIKAGATGTTTTRPSEDTTTSPTTTTPAVATETPTRPKTPDSTRTDGPLTGGDPEVTDVLAGLSSESRGEQVAAVGGLAALAVGALLSDPDNRQKLAELGERPLIAGLKLRDVPGIVDKLVTLSGDSEIEAKWRSVNSSFGPVLGAARSGVAGTPAADGTETRYALFDNGIILDSERTGTHALWGAIGDAWAGQGFDLGALGLPLSEEYAAGDKIKADFEGGEIVYDPATGETEVNLG